MLLQVLRALVDHLAEGRQFGRITPAGDAVTGQLHDLARRDLAQKKVRILDKGGPLSVRRELLVAIGLSPSLYLALVVPQRTAPHLVADTKTYGLPAVRELELLERQLRAEDFALAGLGETGRQAFLIERRCAGISASVDQHEADAVRLANPVP